MFAKSFQKTLSKAAPTIAKKLEDLPLRPPHINHSDWYEKHVPKLLATGKYKGYYL